MKYLKKSIVGIMLGIVLSMSMVGNASARVSLDTGTNSTNVALRDEQLVVNGFESAFMAYESNFGSLLGSVDEAAIAEHARAVEAANAALQAKDFSPKLTPEFEVAVQEYKSTANDVTATVVATANKDYSNDAAFDATAEELDAASASLENAAKALETSAANYEAASLAWVIYLIGGLIVATAIGITAIYATRANKKRLAAIIGNDPNATHLTKEHNKMIIRLYNDIVLYDQSLARNNTTVLQALEMGVYKKFKDLPDKDQYGPYAAFYFELDSLVNLRAQKVEEATASARRVVELRGLDSFVTSRARQLVEKDLSN